MTRTNVKRLNIARGLCLLMGLGAATQAALAQTFPQRTIRLVIPFAAGGSSDLAARLIAQRMGDVLGQGVIADNRAGGGGTLGSDIVAHAAPDGYTLGLATTGTLGINPALYPALPYDPTRAFDPVGQISTGALTFVIGTAVPARTMAEFVTWARGMNGRLNMASSGSGTPPHLVGVLFNRLAGLQATHVPFKGGAPSLAATIAGETHYDLDVVPTSLQQMKAGRIRVLAVTTPTRSAVMPDVPTMAEAGFAGASATVWNGLIAPAGTPPAIIATLNRALNGVLATGEMRQRFADLGLEPVATTPAAFGELVREEMTRWAALVKQSGATVD